MNEKNLVTVVIPTLNNTVGLEYLLNYFKNKPYEIVVVDNIPLCFDFVHIPIKTFKS